MDCPGAPEPWFTLQSPVNEISLQSLTPMTCLEKCKRTFKSQVRIFNFIQVWGIFFVAVKPYNAVPKILKAILKSYTFDFQYACDIWKKF